MLHREHDFGLDVKKESGFCQMGKQERKEKNTERFRSKSASLSVSGVHNTILGKDAVLLRPVPTVLYLSSIWGLRIQPESLKG